MLDINLQAQLKSYLENLKTPVELITFTDESPKAKELSKLVSQITELSPLVSQIDGKLYASDAEQVVNERVPSMLVRSVATGSEMRFAGLPMGHEFTSLVMALLHSGSHPLKLETEQIEQVKNLEGDFEFETYISLSCQNCPDVVQALNMMAAINPQIKNTMIDGALFQTEVFDRDVMAVPSVYLNGESFSQGRVSLTDILNKVDNNSGARQAKALEQKEAYDFLVVGGGPAGAAAAIYAARKGISTGLVADRFGGQVSDTMAIENFISVKATQGPKLVSSLEEHVRDYDVDIMNSNKANRVKRNEETGLVEVSLENGAVLKSKAVVLATGARWREMNVPGENEYRGKGVAYCPHCDGPLFKGKPVAVIGGGNSGIEAAIDLAGIVEHVTVLEFADTARADDVLMRKANSLTNVTIITNAQTTEVFGDGKRVTSLSYTDRLTEKNHELILAGIFVQIGLMPNSEFLQGDIELTNRGEIIAGSRGETSIDGVFAAGDVTNNPYKQIIIAMGSGANAALGAFDYLIRHDV
jgi:alkyl hydroperoxide reductase subunit F